MTTIGEVREGEVLAGKYRVDRVLGAGGMGVVVAAHHLELDERVAIKFLLPDVLGQADAVARFAREARAAVKIKSEHVAKVTDVGKLESGAPYMVMEYLDGSDLSAWLQQRGPLALEQAVEFVLQACEAIAEAHSLGIVHRDLKPSNLFVIRRPDGALAVKVLDFGISKTTSALGAGGGGTLTATSALMGSPLYMSPEQMQSSRDVDVRSDIWAVGVILYQLVTGALPFVADTMPELVLRVVQGAPPASLRARVPNVPEGFDAVVLRCLERDRGRRFESVSALATALVPFAPSRSRVSVERISGVLRAVTSASRAPATTAPALAPPTSGESLAPAIATATATAASWGTTASPKRRTSWLVAGALGASLLVAGIAWRALRSPAPPLARVTGVDAATPAVTHAVAAAPMAERARPVERLPASEATPVVASAVATAAPVSSASPTVAPVGSAVTAATAASVTLPKHAPPSTVSSAQLAARANARVAPPARSAAPPQPTVAARSTASKPSIFDDRK